MLLARVVRQLILRLDAVMRRRLRVYEFAEGEDNLLRLSRQRSHHAFTLADGTRVRVGDPIGELHLWNEHLARLQARDKGVSWALKASHRAMASFRTLARYVEREPGWREVQAFRADVAVAAVNGLARYPQVLSRYGLEPVEVPASAGLLARLHEAASTAYMVGVRWAFSPSSVRLRELRHFRRSQFWISRRALLEKYGRAESREPRAEQTWQGSACRARRDVA